MVCQADEEVIEAVRTIIENGNRLPRILAHDSRSLLLYYRSRKKILDSVYCISSKIIMLVSFSNVLLYH